MKKYEPPVCETIMFDAPDVIVSSNPGDSSKQPLLGEAYDGYDMG